MADSAQRGKEVREFSGLWGELVASRRASQERSDAYTSLASCLKGNAVTTGFVRDMCKHQKQLTQQILGDVTTKTNEQPALQLLGYCLHHPQFAGSFSREDVATTVQVLCTVIKNETADKSLCTRTLWCLANQSFRREYVQLLVPRIVGMVSEVITAHRFETAVVDAEALNVLISIHQQCPTEMAAYAERWYKAIVQLFFCKISKLQRKALDLAMAFEPCLKQKYDIIHWLSRELKESRIANMLRLLGERGQDHCSVLTIWSHFITVLGKTLHKHGSFLNELLKVVEMGFKNKAFVVQVMAYSAWRALITNFSQDLEVITNPRRLKLLLMPLLASAVKERHDHVEIARLQTWWHLIGCLGNSKLELFKQVCVPFLLFCLGVDPKSDLTTLSNLISDLSTLKQNSSLAPPTNQATPTTSSADGSPTANKENALGHSLSKPGLLLSYFTSPKSSLVAKGWGSSYQTSPTPAMVLTGCHAVLIFLGWVVPEDEDGCAGSLIKNDLSTYTVFTRSFVPADIAHFLLLFLDGVHGHASHGSLQVKGKLVEMLTAKVVMAILATIVQGGSLDRKALFCALLQLFNSQVFQEQVSDNAKKDLLVQLCSMRPEVLSLCGDALGLGPWKAVLDLLNKADFFGWESDGFLPCWNGVLVMATPLTHSHQQTISNFHAVLSWLDELVRLRTPRTNLVRLWDNLAKRFITLVLKMNEVNEGTTVDPKFTATRQILKFPFQCILFSVDRVNTGIVMTTWKSLYDIVHVHISLAVKDPNLCAELVCTDLFSAHGNNTKVDAVVTLERSQVNRFDLYHNSVAMALQFIASKMSWGAMRGVDGRGRDGRSKSVQILLSLLTWQLAGFWDSVKKSSVHISQLTSPYFFLNLLSQLYSSFPSTHIIEQATEMVGHPLATLWENILNSPSPARSKHKSHDLQVHMVTLWKDITTCFQARYTKPFNSLILSRLSPLLVTTLTSKNQQLLAITLSFWGSTFGKASFLVYPDKLRDAFSSYSKKAKSPLQLRLPGLHGSGDVTVIESSMSTLSEGASEPMTLESQTQGPSEDPTTVVLPNASPRKGVRGSFLHRGQSPRRSLVSASERSPAAKSMDDVLARSRAKQPEAEGGGVSPSKGREGKSPGLSVRRKLSLNKDEETYVPVAPPAKKTRVLTEHQREKMRERSDIPMLYNALDPSQDNSLPMFSEQQSVQTESDGPIIIPESEVSPATPVSLRRTSQHSSAHPDQDKDRPAVSRSPDAPAQPYAPVPRSASVSGPGSRTVPSSVVGGSVPVSRFKSTSVICSTPSSGPIPISRSTAQPTSVESHPKYNVSKPSAQDLDVTPPIATTTIDLTVDDVIVSRSALSRVIATCVRATSSQAPPPPTTTLGTVPGKSSLPSNPPPLTSVPKIRSVAASSPVDPPRLVHLSHSSVTSCPVTTIVSSRPFTSATKPVQPVMAPPATGITSQRTTPPSSGMIFVSAPGTSGLPSRHKAPPTIVSTAPPIPQYQSVVPRTTGVMALSQSPDHSETLYRLVQNQRQLIQTAAQITRQQMHRSFLSPQAPPPPWPHPPLTMAPPIMSAPPVTALRRSSPVALFVTNGQLPAPGNHGNLVPGSTLAPGRALTVTTVPSLYGQPHRQMEIQGCHTSSAGSASAVARRQISNVVTRQQAALLNPTPYAHPHQHPAFVADTSAILYHQRRSHDVPLVGSTGRGRSGLRLRRRGRPRKYPPQAITGTPTELFDVTTGDLDAVRRSRGRGPRQRGRRGRPRTDRHQSIPVQLSTDVMEVDSHDVPPSKVTQVTPPLHSGQDSLSLPLDTTAVSTPSDRPPSLSTPSDRPLSDSTPSDRHPSVSTSSDRPPSVSTSSDRPPSLSTPSDRPPSVSTSSDRPPSVSTSSDRSPSTCSPVSVIVCPEAEDPLAGLSSHEKVTLVDEAGGPGCEEKNVKEQPALTLLSDTSGPGHEEKNKEEESAITLPSVTESGDKDALPSVTENGDKDALPFVTESGDKDALPFVTENGDKDALPFVTESGDKDALPFVTESGDNDTLPSVTESGDNDRGMEVQGSNGCESGDKPATSNPSDVVVMGTEESPISINDSCPDGEPAGEKPSVKEETEKKQKNTDSSTGPTEVETSQSSNDLLDERPLPPSTDQELEKVSTPLREEKESKDLSTPPVPPPSSSVPQTPTDAVAGAASVSSPRATPVGILKHTSQFDTPSSSSKCRRVQFSNKPLVIEPEATPTSKEDSFKTPRASRGGNRTPQGVFSSRRTLLLSQTPTRTIQVKIQSASEPVYPSLTHCSSPIDQILPTLSPDARFSHGLIQLVRARNIHTIGNISSLTTNQVQTLPIKSPKVGNLRSALRAFEAQQGSKRRSSFDSEGQPPAKQPRLGHAQEEGEGQESCLTEVESSAPEDSEDIVVLSTPESQKSQAVCSGDGLHEPSRPDGDVFSRPSRPDGDISSKEDASPVVDGEEKSDQQLADDGERTTDENLPSVDETDATGVGQQVGSEKSKATEVQAPSDAGAGTVNGDSGTSGDLAIAEVKGVAEEEGVVDVLDTEKEESNGWLDQSEPSGGGDEDMEELGEEREGVDMSESSGVLFTPMEPGSADIEESRYKSTDEGATPPTDAQSGSQGSEVKVGVLQDQDMQTESRDEQEAMELDVEQSQPQVEGGDERLEEDGGESESSAVSCVSLDHSYCTTDQSNATPDPTTATIAESGGSSSTASSAYDSSRFKLSSGNSDHTYCSRPEKEEVPEPTVVVEPSPQPPGMPEAIESQELFGSESAGQLPSDDADEVAVDSEPSEEAAEAVGDQFHDDLSSEMPEANVTPEGNTTSEQPQSSITVSAEDDESDVDTVALSVEATPSISQAPPQSDQPQTKSLDVLSILGHTPLLSSIDDFRRTISTFPVPLEAMSTGTLDNAHPGELFAMHQTLSSHHHALVELRQELVDREKRIMAAQELLMERLKKSMASSL